VIKSAQLKSYLINQCRDELVEVTVHDESNTEGEQTNGEHRTENDADKDVDGELVISEKDSDWDPEGSRSKGGQMRERFQCVVKNCIESASEISSILRHMESSHKAENYFFRTRFNCPQLQSRCVSCQYSFPSESYLQNHDCKAFQNSGSDFDDQAIDNVISDSLEVEGEYMEDGLAAPDGDEMGLTKLRGFKCPIKSCSMKTERLAGILRHLFTRHGYEGLLFRLSPNVWGMSEKCNECGFHFDHLSNSMYKHKYDKACEKNITRKRELEAEYEANPNKKPMSEILSNIDFDSFKERVNVDNPRSSAAQAAKAAEAEAQSKADNLTNQNQANQNNVSNLLAQMRGNYSLSSMINGFGSSPLSPMTSGRPAPYGGLSGGFLQPQAKSTPTSKPRDYSTLTQSSYSSPSSSSTDLIYRCPIIECGKAFSKLGGIFKHLVPAHGYQGVLFRMEHNVPGLSMICETCKWNYADKNAIYKHRHLNTCISNIRITSEQKSKFESDPCRKGISELRSEINFQVLADLTKPTQPASIPAASSLATSSALSFGMNISQDNIADKLKTAMNGLQNGVAIKIADDLQMDSQPIKEMKSSSQSESNSEEANIKSALDLLDGNNMTPELAQQILKIFSQTTDEQVPDTSTDQNLPKMISGASIESLSLTIPDATASETPTETFNQCPAWGCKRKFTSFTHGGKSNISSLWIHMQNAHRAAFVVFRRLKRPGFDKYCEKCKFWLKGAEWYNHRNLRRYQSEGNRPEGTYCDVYQRLAQDLEKMDNPLQLLNIRMCMEQYHCEVPDGDHLAAEQAMQDDNLNFGLENYMDSLPSMVDFHGTDSPTFTFNRPIYHSPSTETSAIESTTNLNSLSPNKESSPLIGRKRSIHSPIKIDIDSGSSLIKSNSSPLAAFKSTLQSSAKITVGLNGQSPVTGHVDMNPCPVKSCGKKFQKSETSEGKNLFTHMKANHPNAYIIFRRLERATTKKKCTECLFWFTNYRDYGAHNQQTGNKRNDSFKGTYCQQYQQMAIDHLKVNNIFELGKDEELDLNILEGTFKCKIPFEMNIGTDGQRSEVNPFDVIDALKNRMASGHSLEPEVSTETFINDDEDQPIHPLHKPEEGSYVCPVKGCGQVIKTMKGVLGHMRIKHKREYVIFRRTKMATAHRKCDECEFWFQSAKTYHQHRSQLPYQSKLKLPSQLGENKGSECDAYVRIASQFNALDLSDMSNFVKELFKFYLESKHQDKPANRKKNVQNNQALNISSLQKSFSNSFNSSSVNQSLSQSHDGSFDQLSQSILSQASMLNPDLQSLLQQSLGGNNSLLNGGAASLSGLASSLSNLNQCSGETEKKETVDSLDTIKRETPSPCTKYRQAQSQLNDFQLKISSLDSSINNSISDDIDIETVEVCCIDKTCSFKAPLKIMFEHMAEKHPYLYNEFRSKESEYLPYRCEICQFYFSTKKSLVAHRLGDECIKNKASLLNYRTLIEKVGEVGKAQLLMNMRDSIKITITKSEEVESINQIVPSASTPIAGSKRKSMIPTKEIDAKKSKIEEIKDVVIPLNELSPKTVLSPKDVANTTPSKEKDLLDSSLESQSDMEASPLKRKLDEIGSDSFDEMKKKQKRDEFTCDYCPNNVSFPIFNLLVAHIKAEHANKYIQFRIKKTAQVPFRCHICNFCFPDEKSYNRHINKKTCEKNLKLFEEYTQSLENDDDDDNSDTDE